MPRLTPFSVSYSPEALCTAAANLFVPERSRISAIKIKVTIEIINCTAEIEKSLKSIKNRIYSILNNDCKAAAVNMV